MNLRKGDCGHWISTEVQPVGYDAERPQYPVYLCAECRERALTPRFILKNAGLQSDEMAETVMARRHGSDGKFVKSRED